VVDDVVFDVVGVVVVGVVGVMVLVVGGGVVVVVVIVVSGGIVVVNVVGVVGVVVEFGTIVKPPHAETNRNSEIKAAMTKNRERLSSFLYMGCLLISSTPIICLPFSPNPHEPLLRILKIIITQL
jgi:hypothetical protein